MWHLSLMGSKRQFQEVAVVQSLPEVCRFLEATKNKNVRIQWYDDLPPDAD